MQVTNIHERALQATPTQVGSLLDSLASPADTLWPWHSWPRMEFDRPLGIGATGGHGPVRYCVEQYVPGQSVTFRFTGPKGFDGWHGFEIISVSGTRVILRHRLQMFTHGLAILSWPMVFRPLHDALLEDALACAQAALGQPPQLQPWSAWVKILRWVFTGGKTRRQGLPAQMVRSSRQVKG